MPELKKPDSQLLERCRQYLLTVEPEPRGELICRGVGLISGLVNGEISEGGQILYIASGQRPGVEELALAEAVTFESETPDGDLLELCRNVGLAAVGGIKKAPLGQIVLDGLRGNLHLKGDIQEKTEKSPWEESILAKLPVPVLSALNGLDELPFARRRGAAGIGLIRSEHFCLHPQRLPLLQQLLLLEDGPLAEKRANELAESLSHDFKIIFDEAPEGPLMFRLLDPPFHEFVDYDSVQRLPGSSNFLNLYQEKISIAPTLIRRGMRLNMQQPAILRVMLKAMDLATHEKSHEDTYLVLPLTSSRSEIEHLITLSAGKPWKIAVMLETPAALMEAPQWFDIVDHFSIGGNDLTQYFLGLSRDDRQDLYHMQRQNIMNFDPFASLDSNLATFIAGFLKKANAANKTVNFCGHQATDAESAQFLIENGISQLTCSIDSLVALRIQLSGVDIQ
jgi:phosphoenolpyruvate synthase/pyruvate phosphate dikinase